MSIPPTMVAENVEIGDIHVRTSRLTDNQTDTGAERFELFGYLEGELTSRRHHQRKKSLRVLHQRLDDRQSERARLPGSEKVYFIHGEFTASMLTRSPQERSSPVP